MRKHDYDTDYNKNTGGTENELAVDDRIKNEDRLAFEEGFAAASGIRPETASSGGRIKHPESKDASRPDPVPKQIEDENAGLADN